MKFYTRKRRAPNVIIVSLIDILVILLIFFIVTTSFKKGLPQLKIALPESKSAATEVAAKSEPLVIEVKDADTLQLGGKPVALDGLAAALRAARESEPDRGVALQADESVPFRVIVRVIDALREAGIRNLPAFARPPGSAPQ